MEIPDTNYQYSAVVKIEQGIMIEAISIFPSLNEAQFRSREFADYLGCVTSCKAFLEDIMQDININAGQLIFKLRAEVNPQYSGIETVSKDWDENELARFWVYDQSQEGKSKKISAVARANIFAVPKANTSVYLN